MTMIHTRQLIRNGKHRASLSLTKEEALIILLTVHVSGTVAAREAGDYGVVGIAPEADIYAYRVLGPYGSGQTSWVLGGIDRSVADGMDVINLSLGAENNDQAMLLQLH